MRLTGEMNGGEVNRTRDGYVRRRREGELLDLDDRCGERVRTEKSDAIMVMSVVLRRMFAAKREEAGCRGLSGDGR